MSEGVREMGTTGTNGTTSVGDRVLRPVTSGVAYNCSGTQFLMPCLVGLPKAFHLNTSPVDLQLRLSVFCGLPRKYAQNIMSFKRSSHAGTRVATDQSGCV